MIAIWAGLIMGFFCSCGGGVALNLPALEGGGGAGLNGTLRAAAFSSI